MPNEDKLRSLYDGLKNSYDLGSYDEFKTKMQDPNKRSKLWSAASSKYSLGDFKSFESKLGYGATPTTGKQAPGSAPGASGGLRLPSGLTGAQIRNLAASGKYKELTSVQGSVAGMTNAELDRAAAEISGKSPEEAARYFKTASMGGTRSFQQQMAQPFARVGEPQQGIQAPSPMAAAPSARSQADRSQLLAGAERTGNLMEDELQGRMKLKTPDELAAEMRGEAQGMPSSTIKAPEQLRTEFETEVKQKRQSQAYKAVNSMNKQQMSEALSKAATKAEEDESDELDLGPYGKYPLGTTPEEIKQNKERASLFDADLTNEIAKEIKRRKQIEDEDEVAQNLYKYFKSNEDLRLALDESQARMVQYTDEYQQALNDPSVTDQQLGELKTKINEELSIQEYGKVFEKYQWEQLPGGEQTALSIAMGGLSAAELAAGISNTGAEILLTSVIGPISPLGFILSDETKNDIRGFVKAPIEFAKEQIETGKKAVGYESVQGQSVLDGLNLLNVSTTVASVGTSLATVAAGTAIGGPVGGVIAGASLIYGDAADDARKAGFNETETQVYALSNAIISGALERAGFKGITKTLVTDAEKRVVLSGIRSQLAKGVKPNTIVKNITSRATNAVESYIRGGLPEGFTEAGQGAQEIALQSVFNNLALEEGQEGFDVPEIDQIGKILLEQFIVGKFSGGIGPAAVSAFSSPNVKYEKIASDVIKGTRSVAQTIETTKSLIATGKITSEQGIAFLENLKIAEAAKASLPNYVTNKEQRKRAISLIMERNAINKSMEGADPDLQDGYKSRLEEIKSELKSIADKKWVAPVSPVVTSSVAGFETAMDALTTDNDQQKSARIFNATVQSQNNGLMTKVVGAMNAGRTVSGVLLDKMSERLTAFADRLDASTEKTPELQKAIATARDLAQKMTNYNAKVESETNGTIPGLNMPNVMARIEAGVEAGDIDFMENTPEEIAMAFSDIMDGKDVSDEDAKTVADFLYDRYSKLRELKQTLNDKLNKATSESQIKKYKNAIFGIDEVLKVLDGDIETAVSYQKEKAFQLSVKSTQQGTTTTAAEPTTQAAPAQATELANEYDPANAQELTDQYNQNNEFTLREEVIKALNSVAKLLAKIAPNVKIYAHTGPIDFRDALLAEGVRDADTRTMDAGAAVYNSDGKIASIHINLYVVNTKPDSFTGVYHEAVHVIFDTLFGENPGLVADMAKAIKKVMPSSISEELTNFLVRYETDPEETKTDEFVTELTAILAKYETQLDKTTKSKIIEVINRFIEMAADVFGVKLDKYLLQNEGDLIDFINSAAVAVRSGLSSDIAKKQTEKIQRKYAVQEQAAGEVPIRAKSKASRGVEEGKPQAEPQGVTEEGKAKEKITTLADETRSRQPEQARNREGRIEGRSLTPLEGAPIIQGASGPDPRLVAVSEKYAKENGIDLKRQSEYVSVDVNRARRIADAYEKLESNPKDPKVKEAYDDLVRQTLDQYKALQDAGYEFSFFDSNSDPYNGNPWDAMRDLRNNKRMAVYGTYDGYGTDGITASEVENNPMLEDTGLRWKDQNGEEKPVLANDLFRAVHDAFGHGLEGAGFRARGEENAWQAHVRLFTGPAVAAITTETRGQNSWLNYGPFGENNRTAKLEDTVFAENKIGLLPEWTWTEGRAGDMEVSEVKEQLEPTAKEETTTLDVRDYDTLTETQKEEIKASSVSSEPVQIRIKSSRGETESKVEFKEGGYKNSYVKKSDIIDFQSFLNKVADEGAKIWFWTADQLGIGVYSDETVNGEHYLDAGPSFALDPKNRKMKVIWASGLKTKTLKDKISESDYIFIISGHPNKAKLFNKTVIDYLKDRIEKSSNESFMSFAKKMIDLDIRNTQISEILKKYKSYFEFRNSKGSDKKELINLLSSQLDKKQTPIKKYLDTIGLNFDVNNLRDGFYSENNFGINDVMLVLKATGVGGKSNHSTYENNILGEVIGVPDIKVNAADIVSEERRKRLGKIDAKKTPITAATGYFIETAQAKPAVKVKASRGQAEGMGYNPNQAADKGSGNDRKLQQDIYDAAMAIYDKVRGMDLLDVAAYVFDEVEKKTGVSLNPVQTAELIKDLNAENRPEYAKDQSGKYRRVGTRSRKGSVMDRVITAISQLDTDRRVNKSIIKGLISALKGGPQYTVEKQADAEAIRDTIFDVFGGVANLEAAKQIYDIAQTTLGGLRSSMFARLANDAYNKARDAKSQEERAAFREIGQRAMLQLAEEATNAGRFNAMIYRIQQLNPEFIVQLELQKIREQTTSQMSNPGKKKRRVQKVATAINQSQQQAAQQATQSSSVQSAISGATGSSPTITSQPTQKSPGQKNAQKQAPAPTAPLSKIQAADKNIKDLKKKLSDIFKGPKTKAARSLPAGIDAEILDIISELARNYIIKGYTDKTALLAKVAADVAAAGGSIGIAYYNQMWVDVSVEAYVQANKNNAASLAGRIVGRVKQEVNPNPKTLDPIAEMIDALFKKATEDFPNIVKAGQSRLEKMISLLENFNEAKAAWEYSKGIVEAKIDALDDTRFSPQDKQRMKDMLDSFFQNDLSPFEIKSTPYSASEKSVTAMLKDEMKEKQMKIEEILLLANTKQASTKQEFIDAIVHDIVSATGLSNTHATKIAEAFANKYDQIVSEKQESILRRYLPTQKSLKTFKRKSTAQKAFEMIKYGALDPSIVVYDQDGNIVDTAKLLAEMFGIEYVDDNLRAALEVYGEAIADTPVGVLRHQVMNDMMMFIQMHKYKIQGSIGDRYMSTVYANMLTSMDTMLKAFNSNILMYNAEFLTQAVRSAAKGDFRLIPLLVRGYYQKKGVGNVDIVKADRALTDVDGYVINAGEEYYAVGPKKVKLSMANPKASAMSGHYEGLLRYSMGINNARAVLKNVAMYENFTNNITGMVYEKHAKTKAGRIWGKYVTLAQKGLGSLDALTTAAATQARFSDLLYDLIRSAAKANGEKISGKEIADAVNMIQGYDAMVQLDALNQAIAEMEEVEEGKVDLSDSRKKALVLARMEEIVMEKMSDRFQALAAQYPWMASLSQSEISDLYDESREISSKIGLMGTPPGIGGVLSHLLGLPGKTIRFSNVQYGAFTNAPVNAVLYLLNGNTPLGFLVTAIRLAKNKRGLSFGSEALVEFYKRQGIRTEMYGEVTGSTLGVERNLEKEDLITRFALIQAPVIAMTFMAGNAILAGLAGAYGEMGGDDEEEEKNKEKSDLLARDGVEYLKEIPVAEREIVFFGDKMAEPGTRRYEGVWKTLPIYVTGSIYGYTGGGYAKMQSLLARHGIEPYTVYAYGRKIFSYRDNPALGAMFMQMGASTDALLFNEGAEMEDSNMGVIMMSGLAQLNLIRDQANLRSISEITELFAGQRAYEGMDKYEERFKLYLSKTAGNIVNTSIMPAELKNLNQDIMAITGQYMDDPKSFKDFAVYRWPVISNIMIEKDKTGPFGYPVKTPPKRVFPVGTEVFKLPLMINGSLSVPTVDELLATEDAKCLYLFERMNNDKYAKMDISSYYQIDKYGNYDKKSFTKEEVDAMRGEYKLIMREFALKNMNEKVPLMFDVNLKVYLSLYGKDKGYSKFGYKRYIVDKVLGDKAKNIILDNADEILNIGTMGMTDEQIEKIMNELKQLPEE